MKITELNDDQKSRLTEALEEDGFANVQDHGAFLSYSKGPRDFELYSLDIGAEYNTDDFINIILREEEYFGSFKNRQESLNFSKSKSLDFQEQFKVRHSTSMKQKTELSDDDTAIDQLPGWKLVGSEDLKNLSKFYTEPSSSELKHVMIKGKSHIMLNHGPGNHFSVYEGTPDLILYMLQENPENFALTPAFMKVAGDIKLEFNDL